MLRFYFLACLMACVALSVAGAAEPGKPDDAVQQLAVESEAVVVARVGSVSLQPQEDGGSFALWIVRSLKGTLRGGRDIIWVHQSDLHGGEVGSQLWLLFLSRDSQSVWRTRRGPKDEGLNKVPNLRAPIVQSVAQFVGNHGEPPDFPEDAGDVQQLIEQAANGGRTAGHEAFAKLAVLGNDVIPQVEEVETRGEHAFCAVARTLLPLIATGPPVNGLRLGLQPLSVELHDADRAIIAARLANITAKELTVATGESLSGEMVRTVTAFDVWKTDAKQRVVGEPLPSVLTVTAGAAENPRSATIPIVHSITPFAVLPIEIELNLECVKNVDKTSIRLAFPQGYVELPGYGTYVLRTHLDCPGPRPDQQRLIDANYWAGGQLVSNPITLKVLENLPPTIEK